jgi:hybrid cluster-associated redox disulfide protein
MNPALSPTLTVSEVLTLWPETVKVFFQYRLGCVGCIIDSFDTLADVADTRGMSLEHFLSELARVIR